MVAPRPQAPAAALGPAAARSASENAVMQQLTKTKMCAFFERGKCASTNCRYAHSADELRRPPNLHKTKLCRAFMQGNCHDPTNCMYAHGETDLRVTTGIYKTQICNFFERGYCKKGERCNHAHGPTDMRPTGPSPAQAQTPEGKYGCAAVYQQQQQQQQQRAGRSPLPLAELLVDTEGNPNSAGPVAAAAADIPSPMKSVAELLRFSSPLPPSPSPHMWGQYSMHGLATPGTDPALLWPRCPRDPIDVLLDHSQHPANPQSGTPYMTGLPLSHCGVPLSPCGGSPYSIEQVYEPYNVEQQFPEPDSVVLDLSTRLASLDAVVRGLAMDVADMRQPATPTATVPPALPAPAAPPAANSSKVDPKRYRI